MAFIHYHESGAFWFTSKEAISEMDREDINTQSPGFYSKEVSNRDASKALEEAFVQIAETPIEMPDIKVDMDNGNEGSGDNGNNGNNGNNKDTQS